jgi:hypothetical protein
MRRKLGWRKAEAKRVRQSVSRAEILTVLYVIAVTAALTCGLGCLLWGANRAYSNLLPVQGMRLYPATVIWFMQAFIIGGCVAFLTCERLHARLLGPEPVVFSVEYTMAAGACPGLLKKALALAAFSLSLIAINNIRKHAILTESGIIDQRAMALSAHRYSFSAINRITLSRVYVHPSKSSVGHVSQSRSLFIWFQDGERWSLKDAELHSNNERSVAELLASRSRHTVEYPDEVVDLPDPVAMARRSWYLGVGLLIFLLAGWTGWWVWKRLVKPR